MNKQAIDKQEKEQETTMHISKDTPETIESAVKFESAEEAWFWFIQAYDARHAGARIFAGGGSLRPCEPVDILKCVDGLYRNRCLQMDHLLVLRHYGKRLTPPDPYHPKEKRAYSLWREALDKLYDPLIKKGIIENNIISFQEQQELFL